jgi:hypothetical protein
MRFHHAPALLAVVALPLLAGVAVAIGAGCSRVPAIGVAVSALATAFAVVVPVTQ